MKTRGVYVINPFENPNKTTAYRVAGTNPGGVRIRENYKTQPEALARKQQLEIEALNFMPEKRITTILSVEEVRRLLAVTAAYKGGKLIPYVTLALFAAIRPTELARLT